MLRRVSVLLLVLFGVAFVVAASDGYLTEDFSGSLTDQWHLYGAPLSGINPTVGNPAPALYPNGDGSYDSGVISLASFDFSGGLIIEADVYVTENGGFDPGISFGLQNPTNRGLDAVGPGADYSVLFKYAWDSTGGWHGNINCHVLAPGDYDTAVARGDSTWITQIDGYLNAWHQFRIDISPTHVVEFRIDGDLIFHSDTALDLSYSNTPLVVGRKRATAYADNILVLERTHVIAQLMDGLAMSFADAENLFLEFGDEVLREALDAAGGSLDKLMAYLYPQDEPQPTPRLVLVSAVQSGSEVTLTIRNAGNGEYDGPVLVVAGLAYSTSWVPEWCTEFLRQDLGQLALRPMDTVTIAFVLPPLPEATFELFRSRLSSVWTGYADPDPKDYIGLRVVAGKPLFAFLPLP
jgi:hypothetical protein